MGLQSISQPDKIPSFNISTVFLHCLESLMIMWNWTISMRFIQISDNTVGHWFLCFFLFFSITGQSVGVRVRSWISQFFNLIRRDNSVKKVLICLSDHLCGVLPVTWEPCSLSWGWSRSRWHGGPAAQTADHWRCSRQGTSLRTGQLQL